MTPLGAAPSRLVQRLLRIDLVRLAVMALVMLLGVGLASTLQSLPLGLPVQSVLTVALCAGLIGLYRFMTFFFEKRWPQDITFHVRWVLLGLLLGFLLCCVVYLILSVTGVAAWQGVQGFTAFQQVLLLSLLAAVGEELVFRGVVFRGLERRFGTGVALAASAVLFGCLHAGNPGATVMSTVTIALEAGVLLAAAYAWSRNLWFTFALHFAWNFTLGGIFGAAVSGHSANGIFKVQLSETASALLTGGAFGPEASIIALLVCLTLAAALVKGAVQAGRWRSPARRGLQRPA